MNFHLNEYDKEIFSIQDGLNIHEFEKKKILNLIQQTDEEVKEIQLKITNLKTEYSVLSDKKQELISKLELYKSLSDKLNDNIQRILISTKTAIKNFSIAQNNLNLAKKEFDEKLNSNRVELEKKIFSIEKIIKEEIKSNGDGMEKIILYQNKLEEIEKLRSDKSEYLQKILNQKTKNMETWSSLRKNLVKVAAGYKKMIDQSKIEAEDKKNKKSTNQLDLSVSTILSNSFISTKTNKNDSDVFLKPKDPIWIQNKFHTPARKSSYLTSTPLNKIPETDETHDNIKERNYYQTPTILIPNLNLTLTPIPRKAQKNNQNLQLRINKFQIADQLDQIETLDEDPLGGNFLNSQFDNYEKNQNPSNKTLAFNSNKSFDLESENQSAIFSDLQFGFKASYKNKNPLDSLNLFKE